MMLPMIGAYLVIPPISLFFSIIIPYTSIFAGKSQFLMVHAVKSALGARPRDGRTKAGDGIRSGRSVGLVNSHGDFITNGTSSWGYSFIHKMGFIWDVHVI
jgi:hypothetical protein